MSATLGGRDEVILLHLVGAALQTWKHSAFPWAPWHSPARWPCPQAPDSSCLRVVNTDRAPPKRYCQARARMYGAYCGATESAGGRERRRLVWQGSGAAGKSRCCTYQRRPSQPCANTPAAHSPAPHHSHTHTHAPRHHSHHPATASAHTGRAGAPGYPCGSR